MEPTKPQEIKRRDIPWWHIALPHASIESAASRFKAAQTEPACIPVLRVHVLCLRSCFLLPIARLDAAFMMEESRRHHQRHLDEYAATEWMKETLEKCECFQKKIATIRSMDKFMLLESLGRYLARAGDTTVKVGERAISLVTMNAVLTSLSPFEEKFALEILDKLLLLVVNVPNHSRQRLGGYLSSIPLRDIKCLISSIAEHLSPQTLSATASAIFAERSNSQDSLAQLSAFVLISSISDMPVQKPDEFIRLASSLCQPFLLYGICTTFSGWLEDKQMLEVMITRHSSILNTVTMWLQFLLRRKKTSRGNETAYSQAALLAVARSLFFHLKAKVIPYIAKLVPILTDVINQHFTTSPYVLVQALRALAVTIGNSAPFFSNANILNTTAKSLIAVLRLGLPVSALPSQTVLTDMKLVQDEAFICLDLLFSAIGSSQFEPYFHDALDCTTKLSRHGLSDHAFSLFCTLISCSDSTRQDVRLPDACTSEWLSIAMPLIINRLWDGFESQDAMPSSSIYLGSTCTRLPDSMKNFARKVEGFTLLADLMSCYPPINFAKFFVDLIELCKVYQGSIHMAMRDASAVALLILSVVGVMIQHNTSLNRHLRTTIKRCVDDLRHIVSLMIKGDISMSEQLRSAPPSFYPQ
ncbi:hypothetical protein NLJ89_g6691 [Agrocybe chaxingu]|uniref:Uncharacterized protein n=1 Tax=Agrocybe chaxingu TaxID=84603 RepID=A0A9W8JY48_9AGAR|nr:hypothetical protein NLJ89_g6691 [Agrocybe chaxingu]